MPSLSPGTPGAKEAYGISILREDLTVRIPPKALDRYNLIENDMVLLSSTRAGEAGLAIMNMEKAKQSVFKKITDKIDRPDKLFLEKSRVFAITGIKNGSIKLNNELRNAFHLKAGDRLLVIKSTTVAMSYTPVEIWIKKFRTRGFFEAIENMKNLEEF